MAELAEWVMSQPLFDTHEHMSGCVQLEREKPEVTYRVFEGYAKNDLLTAARGADLAAEDTYWTAWESARTTGFAQAASLSCRALTGLDYARENAAAITAALHQWIAPRTGWDIYRHCFDLCGIVGVINDPCWDSPTKLAYFQGGEHPPFFRTALRYDRVLRLATPEELAAAEAALGQSCASLTELTTALEGYIHQAHATGGLAAFKCGLAYHHDLHFPQVSPAEAARTFDRVARGQAVDPRPLRAFLFHHLCQRARELRLPVQVHTGLLSGNSRPLAHADPTPLMPTLALYPEVTFDLLHAGWPWSDLMGCVGKTFPNVYLNMCWGWTANPAAMERVLDEWLAGVPHNKILVFGGDTGAPYTLPGYAAQTRSGLAHVLERRVARGDCDLATAQRVAMCLLHRNGQELYSGGEAQRPQ